MLVRALTRPIYLNSVAQKSPIAQPEAVSINTIIAA